MGVRAKLSLITGENKVFIHVCVHDASRNRDPVEGKKCDLIFDGGGTVGGRQCGDSGGTTV